MKDLAGLTGLKHLILSSSSLDERNLVYLSKFRSLTDLDVGRCKITEVGVKHLSSCASLLALSLQDNPGINNNCMSYLLSLKSLKSLYLENTSVTLKGILALHSLRLTHLSVPRSVTSTADMTTIRSMFRGVKIESNEGKGAEFRDVFGTQK